MNSTKSFQPKPNRAALRLNAKKLLLTKWTATKPQNKEKHFIVTRLIEPEVPDAQIELIELEATYSKRCFTLPWRDLKDETQWLQGWK
ncbi:MAG: TIGR02450 family Trp-rich protein [Casimicrobium sp.]